MSSARCTENEEDLGESPSEQTAGVSRRSFVKGASVIGTGVATGLPNLLAAQDRESVAASTPHTFQINTTVNGKPQQFELDTRTTMLDALREHLDLTGTKKG